MTSSLLRNGTFECWSVFEYVSSAWSHWDVILVFILFFLIINLYGIWVACFFCCPYLRESSFPKILVGGLIQLFFLTSQSSHFSCFCIMLKRLWFSFWDFLALFFCCTSILSFFFFFFVVYVLLSFDSISNSFFSVWDPIQEGSHGWFFSGI